MERAATDIYALDADWCEVHDVATVHREDAIAALRAALEAR